MAESQRLFQTLEESISICQYLAIQKNPNINEISNKIQQLAYLKIGLIFYHAAIEHKNSPDECKAEVLQQLQLMLDDIHLHNEDFMTEVTFNIGTFIEEINNA